MQGTEDSIVYTTMYYVYLEHHSTMANLTSRLAISIRYLPNFDFNWTDSAPQQPRSSLTIDDFLPSETDAAILKEQSVCYMMRFLVETFTSLKDLTKPSPKVEPLHSKSQVTPMKILFKDEKYKSATIEILSQLLQDANLSGNEQVKDAQVLLEVEGMCYYY